MLGWIDYTYDNLSRLIEADYSTDRNYQYAYDLAGNRTYQETTIGITTTTTDWTYNNANQMATMQIGANPVINMSFDNNGNLTDDGVLTYTWNRANRLKTLNNGSYNTHFAYDGNGERHQQNVGGTITNYLLDVQPELVIVLGETVSSATTYYLASSGRCKCSYQEKAIEMGYTQFVQEFKQQGLIFGATFGAIFGAGGPLATVMGDVLSALGIAQSAETVIRLFEDFIQDGRIDNECLWVDFAFDLLDVATGKALGARGGGRKGRKPRVPKNKNSQNQPINCKASVGDESTVNVPSTNPNQGRVRTARRNDAEQGVSLRKRRKWDARDFPSKESRDYHFNTHKDRLGVDNMDDYLANANKHIDKGENFSDYDVARHERKDGSIMYWNPKTLEFAIAASKELGGFIITYFKANDEGYFLRTKLDDMSDRY